MPIESMRGFEQSFGHEQDKGEFIEGKVQQEKRKQAFIDTFIKYNPQLSETERTFMQDQVLTRRGPWDVDNHVRAITKEARKNRIIVHTNSGESYYYPEGQTKNQAK